VFHLARTVLFLIPAISMRLWSEERKTGSIELLLTLPVTMWQAVVGKFIAAWAFAGIALALTFPLWITVNYLGDPDNGAIVAGYVGSFLMAGAFLAIGSCLSALTRWRASRWCWRPPARCCRSSWSTPSPASPS
jgi:ABC-2 type transport system permease protein